MTTEIVAFQISMYGFMENRDGFLREKACFGSKLSGRNNGKANSDNGSKISDTARSSELLTRRQHQFLHHVRCHNGEGKGI
jgi:hypothetical protein